MSNVASVYMFMFAGEMIEFYFLADCIIVFKER